MDLRVDGLMGSCSGFSIQVQVNFVQPLKGLYIHNGLQFGFPCGFMLGLGVLFGLHKGKGIQDSCVLNVLYV